MDDLLIDIEINSPLDLVFKIHEMLHNRTYNKQTIYLKYQGSTYSLSIEEEFDSPY